MMLFSQYFEWIRWDFMQQALGASLLASIACGTIGSLVVVNRMVFLAGGIAHAAYGGIGLAVFFRWPLMPTVLGFSSLCSLVIGAVTFNKKHTTDSIVGAVWAVGMALGALLVNLTPGYQADLMGFLFGSILAILPSDIYILLCLDVVLLLWIILFYREILALSYDDEFARVLDIPVRLFHYLLLVFTSISIILLMRFVGLILVLAMLSIPSYIVESWSNSLGKMMFYSTALNLLFMVLGLAVSYIANLSAGPVIILIAGTFFLLTKMLGYLRR